MAEQQKSTDKLFVYVTGDKPRNLLPDARENSNRAYGAEMNRAFEKISEQTFRRLQSAHPKREIVVLSGLELGIEQAAARQALAMNLEVQAFVPFKNHGANWSEENREQYQNLTAKIAAQGKLVEASQKEYNPNLLQLRDYQIIDRADVVVSLHKPDTKPQNQKTLDYAVKHSKEIVNVWDENRNLINEAVKNRAQQFAQEDYKITGNIEKQSVARLEQKVEIWERITRQDVRDNRDKIFLFGDNLKEKGFSGQAKEMRGEINSVGVPTKKSPDNNPNSFFTDQELENNKRAIDLAFTKIPAGKTVVIPSAGLGTGLAKLDEKAPETFKYLNQKLADLGFPNQQQIRQSKTQSDVFIQSNSSNTSTRLLDLNRIQTENLKALEPSEAERNALEANKAEALAQYAERLRQDYKNNRQGLRDGMQLLSESLDAGTRINVSCDCRDNAAMCHADVVKMAIEKVYERGQKLNFSQKQTAKAEVAARKSESKTVAKTEKQTVNPRTQRAINEILAFNETDRALADLNQTDGRNQSEQANFLSQKSQFIRDVYERGAQVRDGVLIVPEEKLSVSPALAVTTQEYAVNKLTDIVKDESRAAQLAPQIVEYGNQIAGETGDGATKLRVFNWIYQSLEGKTEFLPAEEKISHNDNQSRFDDQLQQIRNLAEAMRELEPNDRIEFESLGFLENDLFAERENSLVESDENRIAAEIYEEAVNQEIGAQSEYSIETRESEKTIGSSASEGYERTDLTGGVPQFPVELGDYELNQLLTEQLPEIDRQLEKGVAPKAILKTYNDNVKLSGRDNALNRLEEIYKSQKTNEIARRLENPNLDEAERKSLLTEKAVVETSVLTTTQEDLKAILASRDEVKHLENELQNFASQTTLQQRKNELVEMRDVQLIELQNLQKAEIPNSDNKAQIDAVNQELRNTKARLAELNAGIAERDALEFRLEALKTEQGERDKSKTNATVASIASRDGNASQNKELRQRLDQVDILRQNVIELASPAQFLYAADAAEKSFYETVKRQTHELREKLYISEKADARDVEQENRLKAELNKIGGLQPSFAFKLQNSDVLVIGEASAKAIENRNFAASYIRFQLQKPETRLRHENERYRTYAARLESVVDKSEVLRVASEIRSENADLGLKRGQNGQNFNSREPRPLTNHEMQRLFTEQSPAHYTPEMTVARLSFAHSGESRRLMTMSLTRGEIKPSAEAQKLVDSLESRLQRKDLTGAIAATKHFFESLKTPNDRLRYKNDFDHREIYRILPPQEKDFVYQKTVQQKENLEYRLIYEQQQFIKNVSVSKTDAQTNLRSTEAEKSFHLLSQFNQAAILADKIEPIKLETREIEPREAAALAVLLANNQPEKNFKISRELQQSQSEKHNKLGEILAAFSEAKISDDGRMRVTVQIPGNSQIGRETYLELLEKFYPDKKADAEKFRVGNFHQRAVEEARTKGQNETLKIWGEQILTNVYDKNAAANVLVAEQELNLTLERLKSHQDAARTAHRENSNIVEKYAVRAASKLSDQTVEIVRKNQNSIVRHALTGESTGNLIRTEAANQFLQTVQGEITISDFRRYVANEKLIAEKRDSIQTEFAEITAKQKVLTENRIQTAPTQPSATLGEIYRNAQQAEENRLLTENAREVLSANNFESAQNKSIAEMFERAQAEKIKQNSFAAARIKIEPEYIENDSLNYNEQAFKLADKIQIAHELSINKARPEEIERAFAAAEVEKLGLIEKLEVKQTANNKPLTLVIYENEIAKAEKQILRQAISEKLQSQNEFRSNDNALDLSKFVTAEERRVIAEKAAEIAKERLEPRELAADHRKLGDSAGRQAILTLKQLEAAHNTYQLTKDSSHTREAFVKLDERASLLGDLRREYNRAEKSALLRGGIKNDLIDLVQKNPDLKSTELAEKTNRILLENLSKFDMAVNANLNSQVVAISRDLSTRIEINLNEVGKEAKIQTINPAVTSKGLQEKPKELSSEVLKSSSAKSKEQFSYFR